jgi:hypothetical protein
MADIVDMAQARWAQRLARRLGSWLADGGFGSDANVARARDDARQKLAPFLRGIGKGVALIAGGSHPKFSRAASRKLVLNDNADRGPGRRAIAARAHARKQTSPSTRKDTP